MEKTGQIAPVHTVKPDRNSSIELLRILAACAVVVLHYNGMGNALSISTGVTHEVLVLMESLCVCAVDIFIMISGYFLCTSQKRTWDKPIYLLLLLSIINLIACFINSYLLRGGVSVVSLVHSIIPPANYFVLLYLTLYIVSPYINIVLNRLSIRGRNIMIIVLLLLFSVYSTLMDSYQIIMHQEYMGINPVGAWGQQHGYTIVGFTLCYIIGAWLRLNNFTDRIKRRVIILLIIVTVLGIYVWFNIEAHTVLRGTTRLIEYNALSYSNPLVLALAFFLLLLFANLHFNSKVVNTFAKATFTCYILHLNIIPHLKVNQFAEAGGAKLFFHMFVSVVAVYFLSWVCWIVVDYFVNPITRKFKSRIIINIDEYE